MISNFLKLSVCGVGWVLLSACSTASDAALPSTVEAVSRSFAEAASPSSAPVEAAPGTVTPEVSINAVMVALIDHAGHSLWDVERTGKAPTTDEDWQVLEEHAIQIAASGPAITAGGSGPTDAAWVKSPSWHTYAQDMTNAGTDAMKAARNRDFAALVEANGRLVESCEQCHKAFKPELPSEGISHTHSH
jgi:hypothetical protein